MSHALQVSFHSLLPNEGLVSLAADRYQLMRRVLLGEGECLVSLEKQKGVRRPIAYAVVKVREDGLARAEAAASHADPRIALSLALEEVQEQLGISRFAMLPLPANGR